MEEHNNTNDWLESKIIDIEQLKVAINNIYNALKPLLESIVKEFGKLWDRIGGDTILYCQKAYDQSQWKYIKKGKRYVKVRRHNSEDIGRAFSRKILHYKKQVQRSLSSK